MIVKGGFVHVAFALIKRITIDRFSTSDFRWADNRTKQFQHRQVKKGEIYQFEFGKNTFQVFTITTISFSKKRFHWKNSKKKMMLP